ncbi:unnamed protein product, partial [Scytosiphon promiscuus]
ELAEEPVAFGLRKPLTSWNPLWANVHVYWRLLLDFFAIEGIGNKLRLLFKPPAWRPAQQQSHCKLGQRVLDIETKYDPALPRFNQFYALLQFAFTILFSLSLLGWAAVLDTLLLYLAVAYLCLSFFVHGKYLEGGEQALTLEMVRLVLLPPVVLVLNMSPTTSALLIANAAIAIPLM